MPSTSAWALSNKILQQKQQSDNRKSYKQSVKESGFRVTDIPTRTREAAWMYQSLTSGVKHTSS